jgi:hypothetical protein
MTTPHKATPEQWKSTEKWGALSAESAFSLDSCLLELRDRIAALEAGATCPHIITSDEGTSYCGLAEQGNYPAKPDSSPAPAAEQRIQELISANEALRDRLSVLEEGYDELAARLETVETGKRSQLVEHGNRQGILNSSPAPAGGLVERVACAVCNVTCTDAQARAAILAVAEWLDTRGQHGCSLWLREEVQRNA